MSQIHPFRTAAAVARKRAIGRSLVFTGVLALFAGCGGGGGGGSMGGAAVGLWTWISGDSTVDSPGSYGTKGVTAPTNVPGSRQGAMSWIDDAGNLWLFGGFQSAVLVGRLNDLWRYDGANWTWISGTNLNDQSGIYGVKGTPSINNAPGSRFGAVTWIDSAGNLWLFGGGGHAGGAFGNLNDLWRFNPSNNTWTWVSGANTVNQNGAYGIMGIPSAANVPGARNTAVSWIDGSGNLWLFGGFGRESSGAAPNSTLNDLWRFNPANNTWTWFAGSNSGNQAGVYGTKGTPNPANVPGARNGAMSWTDNSGNLWLFGGVGFDSIGASGILNDLWRFNPSNNTWTWVSGSTTVNQNGVYGTQGSADPANVPGGRSGAVTWIDSSGNLGLFGGFVLPNNILNDLWRFNPTNNAWTWVSGSDMAGQTGTYGTKGVPDAANVPGARSGAVSWVDGAGNLWLFGGTDNTAGFNDLWRFQP